MKQVYDWTTPVALVEKFVSVQGEGRNSGRAAIFVRLAGCNLDCKFADGARCDTPWEKAREKTTVGEVISWASAQKTDAIRKHLITNKEHQIMLVLTGGEPTMSPAFDHLVHGARLANFYVAVETNGTIWKEGLKKCHWVTCSPKHKIAHGKPLHKPTEHTLEQIIGGVDRRVLEMGVHEWRYVISGKDDPIPQYAWGMKHYISPAINADGSGEEWKTGFPGFVPGALERCLEIVHEDPRWAISLQTHKFMGVR